MNDLRSQYPLSKRKFYKDIFGSAFGFILLLAVMTPVILRLTNVSNGAITQERAILYTIGFWVVVFIPVIFNCLSIYKRTKNYQYVEDKGLIIIKESPDSVGVSIEHQGIQAVTMYQDFLDRFFGLYNLQIITDVNNQYAAHIDGLGKKEAEGLKVYILNKVGNQPANADMALSESMHQFSVSFSYVARGIIKALFVGIWLGIFSYIIHILLRMDEFSGISGATMFGIVAWSYIIGRTVFLAWRWRTYKVKLGNNSLCINKSYIRNEELQIPYSSIKETILHQTILQRLFFETTNVTIVATKEVDLGRYTIPDQKKANAEYIKATIQNSSQV